MVNPRGEPLDLTNPRYWQQNARMAIRDVYDALVEIITNADDRYVFLKPKKGRIEIEVERRRKGTPSIIRIRDFADGMTLDVMKKKLRRVGDRVSGMAEGAAVRGTNSRGAKDVAILGGVVFESFAADGHYHKCEITPQGRFIPHPISKDNVALQRVQLNMPEGTGTVVTISVDSEVHRIPHHDTLRQELRQLVVLRDIISSPDREVVLRDVNQGRSDVIAPLAFEGQERVSERFMVPGYEGAEAKIVIKRARERLEDQRPRFRLGGILIKCKHAIHEATLFAPDLENDPNAKWFYGRLTCTTIDDIWNDFDNRFEKGLPPTSKNPRPIFDPMRKEGLSREHPFVDALFKEALKRLRPLVEEERKQAEHQQAKIESDDTRKRLRVLEKAAAKFIGENQEQEESTRDADDTVADSAFENKGFSLNPPFAQIILGHGARFWLNIKQGAFPELSGGDLVEISCATDEIGVSKRLEALEQHPNRDGVLRAVWTVKGEKITKATAVKARVGAITAESTIEVLEAEKDRYTHIKDFCFSRKRYSVQADARKAVTLFAPCPDLISKPTPFEIVCSNPGFKIGGACVLLPSPNLGVARCKLGITASKSELSGTLRAFVLGHECEAQVVSVEPLGATIKIKLEDADRGNQRYYWRGNVLEIAARHPALRRYLGPAPDFPGQEDKHFRVLLAEIVAEAVCARLVGRNESARTEEYSDADWDAYYAEYSAYLTKFLPIAHETQVKLQ